MKERKMEGMKERRKDGKKEGKEDGKKERQKAVENTFFKEKEKKVRDPNKI